MGSIATVSYTHLDVYKRQARSRALGGSGIGLTIARAVVEAHDGQIWAASAGQGQGATFSFSLPMADTASS